MIDAHCVTLSSEDDFEGWRDSARDLAEAGVPPEAVVWRVEGGESDLFAAETPQPKGASFAVPRAFIDLAKSAVCHSDPERFALLYAML
ncbi:MAG TPA: uracil-DNA glycosylase, partial [Sphingomicrobium sp.]|nr:uracil-DNA glycosylase [Sphingomicrobium sp.]